jgi:AcrR family transcriptional regulator
MAKRGARGTLTRESVTDAALAIADRDGFRAITMRAIAADVGATAMALYAYFANKEALYAGMRERIFFLHVGADRISRQSWQSMLEGLARGLYQVMHERPNWTPVFAYHSGPASSGLGFIDDSVRLMREDGISMEDAFAAYWGTMSFAVGSAMCERLMMGAGDGCARLLERLRDLPVHAPGRYETLASAAQNLVGWSWDDAFERGIRSLLAGIEAKRAPKFPPKRRPRA